MKAIKYCYWCGTKIGGKGKRRTFDHLVPISRGGDNRPENLVESCEECNTLKGNKTTFRGKNVYKITGIEKPKYVELHEELIKRLKKNNKFYKWYETLDEGNQDYFDNTMINVLRDV